MLETDWANVKFLCKDWKGSFILDGEAVEEI